MTEFESEEPTPDIEPSVQSGDPLTDSTIVIGSVIYDADRPMAPGYALPPDTVAAIEALPQTSALLVVRHGPTAGARFLLDAEKTTAGRSTKSDIFLDDVTVSRRHAEFVRAEDGFTVKDVGSLNGTYVNRERIDSVELHAGDEVQIGKYRFSFHPSPQRQDQVTDES